jgi:hypothetical protein
MTKILHILNGDSTKSIFKKSNLKEDILVWREMLCEGESDVNIGTDEFWTKRYEFFEKELGISKLEYYDTTIKEILPIEDLEGYDEVVLWFEYDLFCQINLIALCTYLLQSYRKDILYYLVCTGKEKGKQNLQSLSDYTSESYQKLYENRIKLSRNDLLFAQESWKLYVDNEKIKLESFHFNKNKKFRYLQKAIAQHIKRFPAENGRNQIENKLLQLINAEKFTEKQIIYEMLSWQKEETVYGFSDLQYSHILKKIKDFYVEEEGILKRNETGKKIKL